MNFVIAIVGRPNVGKSRLFNRLTGGREAIVHDLAGVTRDRQYGEGSFAGRPFTVVDTGGLVPEATDDVVERMHGQVDIAVGEADAVIFMMDGREGLLPGDREIAETLRAARKPVFFAVNKCDQRDKRYEQLAEFYELGVDLHPISAEHDIGVDGLMGEVMEAAEDDRADGKGEDEERELPDYPRCAIVGKPNAGKSTLLNALLGEDRVITSEIPGTTRDAIDSRLKRGDREYQLIDTAGLRRRTNISEHLEKIAGHKAIKSLERADIAILVIDAPEGVTSQDKKIIDLVETRGCGCVVVANKWDQLERRQNTGDMYQRYLASELPFLDWAPKVFTSAKTGRNVLKVLDAVDVAFEQYTSRVDTSTLNDFLQEATGRHAPPNHKGHPVKFYYGTQVDTRPPQFIFFVNKPEGVHKTYKQYLANELREAFGFEGTPVKIEIRGRDGD